MLSIRSQWRMMHADGCASPFGVFLERALVFVAVRVTRAARAACVRLIAVQVALRNIRREAVDAVKKAEKSKNLGKDQVRFTGSRHRHLGVYPAVVVAHRSVRLGWA